MQSTERRRWTLKEIVQGKPIGHPSHPMFVHFPVAFYVGALGLDLLSHVAYMPAAPLAATWLIVAALAATAIAAPLGLVDWWDMKPGSRARRTANSHMLWQLTTTALFVANLALRFNQRHVPHARPAWIALGVIGVLTLSAGQYLGGMLVYQMGFRVYSKKDDSPAEGDGQIRRVS